MDIKNNMKYLLCVYLYLHIQTHIDCLDLTHPACCNPSSLSDDNTFLTNPLYNPLILDSESDPFESGLKTFGLAIPPAFPNIQEKDTSSIKAYSCSLIPCLESDSKAVCACNYNTGNVVTFRNSCDVEKHNCRFNTGFKVILDEICPWEFQSRRNNKDFQIDYNDPKYYN